MRRAKLLPRPTLPAQAITLGDLVHESGEEGPEAATLHFRHRCDDAWYEALIAAQGLEGKRITPTRVRRLLVEALERYREEGR
jgi:hypothetical protein